MKVFPTWLSIISMGLSLLSTTQAHAAWSPLGNPVTLDPSISGVEGVGGNITTDPLGGAYVQWRVPTPQGVRMYVQRIGLDGLPGPGWAGAGVQTGPIGDVDFGDLSGTSGGVWVSVLDRTRLLQSRADVNMTFVTTLGVKPIAYPPEGVVLGVPQYDYDSSIAADGAGGAFAAWEDNATGNYDIRAGRVISDGSIPPGWTPQGRVVCSAPRSQTSAQVLADGSGGAYVSWGDARSGFYLARYQSDGSLAQGYPDNGKPVLIGGSPPMYGALEMVTDGQGGLIALIIQPGLQSSFENNYYALRVLPDGTSAPGWLPANAQPVPIVVGADLDQANAHIAPDGSGGCFVSWDDQRNYSSSAMDIYLNHILADGTRAPGFPANGLRLTDSPEFDDFNRLAPDGTGGCYVVWTRGATSTPQIYGTHILANGQRAPGYPPGGLPIAPTGTPEDEAEICSDGFGGAIVLWYDARSPRVYLQRMVPDGIVAISAVLAEQELRPDRIRLRWRMAGVDGQSIAVERREGDGDWQAVAQHLPDGEGNVNHEDLTVTSGQRLSYRLTWTSEGSTRHGGEVELLVPGRELALAGAATNPVRGPLQIRFTLPDARPASLELYDVSGRQVERHEVGQRGQGGHELWIAGGRPMEPGIYWVRLTHADGIKTAKVVVMR